MSLLDPEKLLPDSESLMQFYHWKRQRQQK